MPKEDFCGPFMAILVQEVQHGLMAKPPPSNRIEEIRKAKGMTLEELADRSGFSTPFVWQMAHGVRNIKLANLERLATALGCRAEDLISTSTPTNTDILDIWAAIPSDRRDLARQVLESFAAPPMTTHPDNASVHLGTQNKKRPRNQE